MKVKIIATAIGEETTAEIRAARLEDIPLWQQWKEQMPTGVGTNISQWQRCTLSSWPALLSWLKRECRD